MADLEVLIPVRLAGPDGCECIPLAEYVARKTCVAVAKELGLSRQQVYRRVKREPRDWWALVHEGRVLTTIEVESHVVKVSH